MLVDWISMYDNRKDTFSKVAHKKLFDSFKAKKLCLFQMNDAYNKVQTANKKLIVCS